MLELSPENRNYVDALVAAGAYPSALAALDEAVLLLRRRDEVRRKLDAAVAQADQGQLIPAEQVFARMEQKAREIEQSANRPK
jgi:hypothetical protein